MLKRQNLYDADTVPTALAVRASFYGCTVERETAISFWITAEFFSVPYKGLIAVYRSGDIWYRGYRK